MFIACGKVLIESFGSRTSAEKLKAMKPFVEDVRKTFHISIDIIDELDDIERTWLGFSIISADEKIVNQKIKQIFLYIDTHAPGRVTIENKEIYCMD